MGLTVYRDKLLVVGAGPVGLAMAKALKQRGIGYDQIDANDGVGGLWRNGVYASAHIVSSKRTTAFADYPMPADYPDFPSAAQMLRYLEDFARDCGVLETIELGRRVLRARPLSDHSWVVRLNGAEDRHYKGLVICNGHHWHPRLPLIAGSFDGEVMHAKSYTGPCQLEGRRVLVIGGGNSACDIASEAGRVAARCDLSLRSGYWFLPKTAFGRPLTDLSIWSLPVFAQRLILRAIIAIIIGDYRAYGLPWPNHKLFERHPMYGTEVLGYLRQGRVRPRPAISHAAGKRVWFDDGTSAEFDLIVAATGYANTFPFLASGIVNVVNDAAQIYGGAFPANVNNLYIIGSSQPRNGFGSLVTPATRLYARMIEMQDEIDVPIGQILEWNGDRLPAHNLINPATAKREIWIGEHFLPLLKVQLRYHRWRQNRAGVGSKRNRASARRGIFEQRPTVS